MSFIERVNCDDWIRCSNKLKLARVGVGEVSKGVEESNGARFNNAYIAKESC